MAFTLHLSDNSRCDFDEEDAQYLFNQHGMLVVHHGSGKRTTYSPGAWKWVEDEPVPPMVHGL